MKIVNYAIAVPLLVVAGLSAGIGVFGVVGELALARVDNPANYATISEAVAFVTERAAVFDGIGAFVTLAATTALFASVGLLFVALGFGIKHGYQLGWIANIFLYVAGPLVVGGLFGQFLVATLLVVVLPTTWWPIVGRGAVNFDPSLGDEPRELVPALLREYRRLVTYPL